MPKSYLPIKLLGEGQACITGPPDDHLGRQPQAPADEVDHQHQDQHLHEQIVNMYCTMLTFIILLLPLLIAVAAVQAWLLWYLKL